MNSNLVISNIYGAIIREIEIETSKQIIDISDLVSGVYFMSTKNQDRYFSKKIIKL